MSNGITLGLSAVAAGTAVFPGTYVAMVDLETSESIIVPWEITETGPVDIKYIA